MTIQRAIELIGRENVEKLIADDAGGRLNLPKKTVTVEFDTQDAKIQTFRDLYFLGKSTYEIAAKFDLTAKYVSELINRRE
jgi:hypothetical protein